MVGTIDPTDMIHYSGKRHLGFHIDLSSMLKKCKVSQSFDVHFSFFTDFDLHVLIGALVHSVHSIECLSDARHVLIILAWPFVQSRFRASSPDIQGTNTLAGASDQVNAWSDIADSWGLVNVTSVSRGRSL